MAEPQESVPESATHGGREDRGDGEEALRDALAEHGDRLAAAVEATDDLEELVTLAILVTASADDAEIENVTASLSALVEAGDGLATPATARLAGQVGENADDLTDALELVLDLQREGDLEELLETAQLLAALDIDEDAVRGLNSLVSALSEAEREAEPVGLLGALRQLRSRDGRAGLGYLVGLLRALGRTVRHRR